MSVREEIIGRARLILGDAREIIPSLPRENAAVVSDVPYGIAFTYGAHGKGLHRRSGPSRPIAGDDQPFDPTHLFDWPCILFGANHYCQRLPTGGQFLAWDKNLGIGPDDDFADVEFIWTSFKTKARVFRHLWKGVLQDSEKGVKKFHVSQKPVALMEWCIGLLRDEPDIIIDPYLGSGSTGVAAVKMGRQFIGCEIDEANFDIACRRIEEAQRQGDLFIGEAA